MSEKTAEQKKIEQINLFLKENRIYAFNRQRNPLYPEIREANPLQKRLLEAWKNPAYKVFTYTGGNRIGKCQSYQTLIDTIEYGKVKLGKLYEMGKPFKVYAFNGRKFVTGKAKPPIKKDGLHQCYRITMSDGSWCEPADFHHVLTSSGWRSVHQIYTFLNNQRQTNSGTCLSVLPSGVLHCGEIPLDCHGDYSEDCRQYLSCGSYEPPLCSGNSIININPIGAKEVYDFEVEKYHNYFSGGLIHHNTTIGAIIAISVVLGEWPWSGEKIPFPHNEPRKIRYIGQAWESHVKAVIEPALKFWWPKANKVETRKNNQGIEAIWVAGRRGTIEIMSNVQDSDVFEGWNGDLIIYDEPPKRNVRVAAARGLIDRQGRELFCMTLLKEAWINREVINATLPSGEVDLSVFNISGDIYTNVGYGITKEGIDQFAKTLTEDEKKARLDGNPSYLTSLVFPKFKRHIHVKERFKIPLDALVDISIDFHPSKPWAIVFVATLKNGFKYVCDEIADRGNPKYIAEEITRRIRERDYLRVNSITIDPLSKGGEGNEIDVYSIVSDTLAAHNYSLETASKDKDNGIAIVNNLLWTENEMPGLYFFKDCVKTIQQTENLMYDAETFKPQKVDDDFTECLYRCTLKNTEWYPEEQVYGNLKKSVVL